MRHKVIFGWVSLFILFSMVAYPLSDMLPRDYNSSIVDTTAEQTAGEALNELPILFIENQGQLDEEVEYYVKAPSQMLYFTRGSIIFDLNRYNQAEATGGGEGQAERLVFSLDFLGADKQPTIEGIGRDSAVVNYLTGNDPEKWHTGISTCREVVYRDIYPAVDLRLRGNEDGLEYDFLVRPGAAPEDINLAYNGINSLAIENGELVVGTAFGNMKQGRPYIYQQIADEKVEVAGGFRLGSDNTYGFFVAAYDNSYPLVIDPTLIYSTYLGGSTGEDMGEPGGIGQDSGWGIAVDTSGSAYVVGITASSDFPTQIPYQGTIAGGFDVFVSKLSATGSRLIYSTYLGGSSWDNGISIAVDTTGCAYVTGDTLSDDFPTLNPYQGANAGSYDAFITKLSATGSSLIYSTYLGGSEIDTGFGIAVDIAGNVYFAGRTNSSDFPTENPYQGTYAGGVGGYMDAFVAKLSAAGDSLVYSTYLGGDGNDVAFGMAIDAGGSVYAAGWTTSDDFPTQDPYQAARAGNSDAFITKLSVTGDSLIYSTYLGGGAPDFGADHADGIAVDVAGCAYITGITDSSSFPTETPYQDTNGGDNDAFVTKLSAAGDSLVYSTYLGGSNMDEGRSISVNADGEAYVTGQTRSDDFPIQNPFQGTFGGGGSDAFVTKLSPEGDILVYSTYLGGSDTDTGLDIVVDTVGEAYVTGQTYSTDFPTRNAYQGAYAGSDGDAFVAKLGRTPAATVTSATGTGSVTFVVDSGSISDLTAILVTPCGFFPFPGVTFPHGFFSFNITEIDPGSTVTVSITFPTFILPGAQYWKCTPTGWLNIPVDSIAGNVMTIRLTDGGLGDSDGVANGTIVDPGGLVVLLQVPTMPAQSGVSPSLPRQLNQAQIYVKYLNVNPRQASANQPVTITTNVVNIGDQAGSLNVALKVNGQVEQTRIVSVGPQATQPVKFTVSRSEPGTYSIDIYDQSGSFTVNSVGGKPVNSGVVVLIAMVILVLTATVLLVMKFSSGGGGKRGTRVVG